MLPDLRRCQRRGQIDASRFLSDQSLQHALDIAIDHGYRFGKRDAGDGRGGITSDARQGAQGFGILRETAALLLGDLPRALVHHPRSPIVAETAPGGQHGLFRSCGERLHVRKALEENPVVVKHGGHARLLQHDFTEPDAIRVAGFSPRKVAAMLVVPAEQRAPETIEILTLSLVEIADLTRDASRGDSSRRRGEPRLYGDAPCNHHY